MPDIDISGKIGEGQLKKPMKIPTGSFWLKLSFSQTYSQSKCQIDINRNLAVNLIRNCITHKILIMAINLNEHLGQVLDTHKMARIDELLAKYKEKRTAIKEALEEHYTDSIYGPFNSGSYAKHTAINCKFDLDLVVPFSKGAFTTLGAMFDDLYDFLQEKYGEEATVRKQKVSIGVIFHADEDGDEINIDVVPGRELSEDDYPESDDLNLYFNETTGFFSKSSYLKTNINAQIEHIKAKSDERKVIRLLKIWKHTNNENYKSFLLELITIKAFAKEDITGNLWDKLKKVMEYIRDNVAQEGFKLKDPGNSNNDVIQTLSEWERSALSNRMNIILKRIDDNEENIKSYFPVNEKYQPKQAASNSFGIKGAAIAPSIPSDNQRFGGE